MAPSEAQAGVIKDIGDALALIVLVGVTVIGTVSTLTTVATYKNYRSSSRHEEASGGWVGVGFVGGLAHAGVGAVMFSDGLPKTYPSSCPDAQSSVDLGRYTPTANPNRCDYHEPAGTGRLVFGTLLMGAGVFAMGFAVKAATTDERTVAPASPGATPAFVGLSLPTMRFLPRGDLTDTTASPRSRWLAGRWRRRRGQTRRSRGRSWAGRSARRPG